MQPVLLGGLFIGVLSALPVVNICNCCCVWILGGGVLAAYLQQQHQPGPVTVGQGAWVGLLAGVAGAFIWFIVVLALDPLISPILGRLASELLRSSPNLPPEVREVFERAEDGTPRAAYAVWFVIRLFGASLVAAVGGMIGATYFKKDVPPALGGPIAPPPLP